MRLRSLLSAIGTLVTMAGCSSADRTPLGVVSKVDLQRYAGKWYEIAAYPAPFEAGCTGTTAKYTLRDDGRVNVLSTCRSGTLDGPVRTAKATARVADPQTNAKLKVSFFWPFEGDYWIIELDENYQWAVVGEPRRGYLWVLSRTPAMDESLYQSIVSRLPAKGYDASRLVRTVQVGGHP